jgi:hypothetical protein
LIISSEESIWQGRGDAIFPILSNFCFLDDGDNNNDVDEKAGQKLWITYFKH